MKTGHDSTGCQLSDGALLLLDGPVTVGIRGTGAASDPDPASLIADSEDLVRIHQSYIAAGCDVIRTPTSALPRVSGGAGSPGPAGHARPIRWVDLARESIEAARAAAAGTRASVAFTLGRQVDGPDGEEIVSVLSRLFRQVPPDLILVESLTVVRPSLYQAVEGLRSLGLPVWLSFRRCREGLCGSGGQHWAGDGPDSFGHAVSRLEKLGADAILVNCIPREHVEDTIEYLRYFTDLPLGASPDLDPGLVSQPEADGRPAGYAELARRWRRAGAQLIGACCGGGPGLVAELRRELTGEPVPVAGQQAAATAQPARLAARGATPSPPVRPWANARGRPLFPLPLPRVAHCDGVAPPDAGELLLWEYLYREGGGANQRCLHVGSGSGLLAVQLALNGATHVHAIDIDPQAVRSTLESAFLNDVSSSLTAQVADLNTWLPGERYELVVASVEQPPADPCQSDPYDREFDPWGRRLIDGLITRLAVFLAREGVAYLTQTSLTSQRRTMQMLRAAGMEAHVVAWHFWPVDVPQEDKPHLDQVERASDAFHFRVAGSDIVVVYLLEIQRRRPPARTAVTSEANGKALS
jgi:release factor glutamine methyltransferase